MKFRHMLRRLAPTPGSLLARLVEQPGTPADPMIAVLLDDAPYGALIVNADGRVVRANLALRRMVPGLEILPGMPADMVFAAEVRESVWAEVAPLLAGRPYVSREVVVPMATTPAPPGEPGGEVWPALAVVSAVPLGKAGSSREGVLLRITDITAQRQLEARLAQSQKLQAVGQLAGGIAHDFNNLLTAVLGAAEAICQRRDLHPEVREDAEHITASAQRGAALVRQLLAFGRQQHLQPRVLAVNDVITDISSLLRRLLGSRIQLTLELETPGRSVRADPTQLDQVLVNLAVNARDAMPDGGELTLRSGHMTIYRPLARGPETIPPGRYVMIEVSDTGHGIPPEILPHVFEPFFTTKRERGGTGLGLSTVHGIIRQSGGFLVVDSEPDQGTQFRIYLPRWDEAQPVTIPRVPEHAHPAVAAPAGRPHAVLLVEDEHQVRRLAERTLDRQGWRVLSADSAEAALARLDAPDAGPIAAVVTDMVMPGLDGAALVRAVRARLGEPDLPAVLVSGYAEEALRGDLDVAGTAFLAKPYTLNDLAETLRRVTAARGVVPAQLQG